MAARLMMYYPKRVTCDNETFYHSKLPKGDFITQEAKEMKGLASIGTIREYCEGLGWVPYAKFQVTEALFDLKHNRNTWSTWYSLFKIGLTSTTVPSFILRNGSQNWFK